MAHLTLTLLILLPLGGGLLAFAFQRGGRAAAVVLALLTFCIATWAALRFDDPRWPSLDRSWEQTVARRIARVVGGAGTAPLPLEEGHLPWAAPPDSVVQSRFFAHLVRGGDASARSSLLDQLSGWEVTEAEVRTLNTAPVDSATAPLLAEAVDARDRSAAERRRLELALVRLEAEVGSLREAGRGSLAQRFKFVEQRPWMPGLGVQWVLGVDGLSMALVWLVSLLGLLCAVSALSHPGPVAGAILAAEATLIGAFVSLDVVLLSAFWILSLVPVYLLIAGGPGSPGARSARRAVVPGFLGALVLAVALIGLGVRSGGGSTNLLVLTEAAQHLTRQSQAVLFVALFLGCAVRFPLPPLHGWLPAAQAELPPPFAAFLQGGVMTLGGYGLFRLVWPLCPDVVSDPRVASTLAVLAVLTLTFAGLVAIASRDLRRTLAMTSVGHAGLVLLGLTLGTSASIAGAALELVAHGLAMGAACLALGVLVERTRDSDVGAMGGLLGPLPHLGGVAAIACLSLVGLPGLVGFVSRMLVLVGGWNTSLVPRWVVVMALGAVALCGVGLWWTFQRVFLGERHGRERLRDLSGGEGASQIPLVILCLVFGLAPPLILDLVVQGTEGIVALVAR
jgi:NADH-quinone oxidoreductase subunit M